MITELSPLLIMLIIILAVAYALLSTLFDNQKEKIATYLTLAERDLNNLLGSGLQHGGRREKVQERRDWHNWFAPVRQPTVQVNMSGYRDAVHDMLENNEKDLAGKGSAMGKASTTAFLLRELYEGNVEAAQSKIYVDTLNNDGKPPYIAPGIYELVGFKHFSPETGFPPKSGVNQFLLRSVVRQWRFPRAIQIVKTDPTGVRFRITGAEVITDLTQQNV